MALDDRGCDRDGAHAGAGIRHCSRRRGRPAGIPAPGLCLSVCCTPHRRRRSRSRRRPGGWRVREGLAGDGKSQPRTAKEYVPVVDAAWKDSARRRLRHGHPPRSAATGENS